MSGEGMTVGMMLVCLEHPITKGNSRREVVGLGDMEHAPVPGHAFRRQAPRRIPHAGDPNLEYLELRLEIEDLARSWPDKHRSILGALCQGMKSREIEKKLTVSSKTISRLRKVVQQHLRPRYRFL